MTPACRQCGRCCERFWLPLTPDELEWERLRFLTGKGTHTRYVEEVAYIAGFVEVVERCAEGNGAFYRCTRLTPENRCAVYRSRPHMCREFPLYGRPTPQKHRIWEKCGFASLLPTETLGEERKAS